jgi:hypothetical protein
LDDLSMGPLALLSATIGLSIIDLSPAAISDGER